MHTIHPWLSKAISAAALTVIAVAASTGLNAQQTPPATSNLRASLAVPSDPFALYFSSSSSSTSSSSSIAAVAQEPFTLGDSMQPPPRRRYGRPRYTDSAHNADGSNKYTFVVGGGFTLPTGGTHSYAKTNFNLQAGVGRNFNNHAAVLIQFDYARFGLQTAVLNQLLATYNNEIAAYNKTVSPANQYPLLTQLGGSTHVWSFTLNPVYNFSGSDKTGAYVTGGVGFYHKVTDITVPTVGTAYSYYYGYYQYTANQTFDQYTSNAVGVNGGVGFTYKPSRFANQRFFAEARYVYVANQARPFSEGSASNSYYNVFPQNSAKTTYVPITLGVRF